MLHLLLHNSSWYHSTVPDNLVMVGNWKSSCAWGVYILLLTINSHAHYIHRLCYQCCYVMLSAYFQLGIFLRFIDWNMCCKSVLVHLSPIRAPSLNILYLRLHFCERNSVWMWTFRSNKSNKLHGCIYTDWLCYLFFLYMCLLFHAEICRLCQFIITRWSFRILQSASQIHGLQKKVNLKRTRTAVKFTKIKSIIRCSSLWSWLTRK